MEKCRRYTSWTEDMTSRRALVYARNDVVISARHLKGAL